MGEKGQIEGASSPRTGSHSWGLHNYLQMSGPQIHFCLNYMIDCPKGPEFPLNNCIMFLLCFSWRDLVMRVKQMWLISSGSPNAFQGVMYSFWTGQNQPCLHSQRAINIFQIRRTKMCECKWSQPSIFCTKRREACSKLTGIWFGNGFVLFIKFRALKFCGCSLPARQGLLLWRLT